MTRIAIGDRDGRSTLANLIADRGVAGDLARARLAREGSASIPDLADAETASVFRKRWLAADLNDAQCVAALADLRDLNLARYPAMPFLSRAFELRPNLNVYDGLYVALADVLDCPLVTADARLARAPGIECVVEVLVA